MGEQLTPGSGERVIRTRSDMAAAMAEYFLGNADAGDHARNDDFVAALGSWRREHGKWAS